MKFAMLAGELADAVAWTAHALPRRAQHPVLNGMLIEADQDVVFSCFDYETSRRRTLDVDSTIEPGRVLLPGKLLAELAKTLPKQDPVEVEADEAKARIRAGKAAFEIPALPVEDFPRLPSLPEPAGRVSAKMLGDAVGRVAVAASRDETLPMLSGVRVEAGGGLMRLAATDRYRIAWRTLRWESTLDDAEIAAVVPAKALSDIVKGLPDADRVEVAFNPSLAAFRGGGRETTVRLLDSEYPKLQAHYGRVVEEAPHVAVVDAAELAAVVRRVCVLARPSTPIRLGFTSGGVLVEAGDAEGGAGREQAACELSGDDVTVAFNPRFLLDALAAVGGRVQVHMLGDGRPALFREPGRDEPDYWHVVMAVRLS